MRSLKLPDHVQIVMNHAAQNILRLERSRVPAHFHETESVVDEARLISLHALTLHDVAVGHLCAAQVLHVECPVLLQRFGMDQLDLRPGLALRLNPAPADHVLSHIDHKGPFACLGHALGCQNFCHANRRHHLRLELTGGNLFLAHLLDLEPALRLEGQVIPTVQLHPRIIRLAVKLVIETDRPFVGHLPALVRDDLLDTPVFIFHTHQSASHRHSIMVAHTGIGIAPVAQHHTQHVLLLVQVLLDVKRLESQRLSVISRHGVKHMIPDLGAVEIQFKKSQSRNMGISRLDRLLRIEREILAQEQRRQIQHFSILTRFIPGGYSDGSLHDYRLPTRCAHLCARPAFGFIFGGLPALVGRDHLRRAVFKNDLHHRRQPGISFRAVYRRNANRVLTGLREFFQVKE